MVHSFDDVVLDEGELICSKCEGRGYVPKEVKFDEIQQVCPKCDGEGKIDWVTNAMQKENTRYRLSGNWTIENEQDIQNLYGMSLQEELANNLAQQIALDIDKEIINRIKITSKILKT